MFETPFNKVLSYSPHELIQRLEKNLRKKYLSEKLFVLPSCPRHLARLVHKLRLNTWNTKYSRDITCICKENISIRHLLFECSILTQAYKEQNIFTKNTDSVDSVINSPCFFDIAVVIAQSPIAKLL